jgi:AraC-like DNA-binding protein
MVWAAECKSDEAHGVARVDARNVTKYWWDPQISGLSLMCADFTSHDYAAHTHDAFVIAVTELGGARIRSRRITEPACPAQLFVSNPDEPQSSSMGDCRRWRYRSMYLTQPAIDVVARGLGVGAVPHFTSNFLADTDLAVRFATLHRVLETGGDRFRAHELLIGAFGRLFQRHGSGGARVACAPRDQTILSRVGDLMRARFAESLLLDDVAAAVGLTVFQLIGLFKRTIGATPHVYLTHVRLNAACRYLRLGYPLAETAIAAGFCDQSALSRHFKRCYGITPLQFANAAAGKA